MRARFINEVLQPDEKLFDEVKQIFFEVKDLDTYDPFYELNQRLNPLGISLVDYKNHFEALKPEERETFKKANLIPSLGIRLLGYEPSINQIEIIVDETFDDKFLRMPKQLINNALNQMWLGFGHETIHRTQTDRMKVKQDPEFKSREQYYRNKQEIMAMAFSFIQEMLNFHTEEEILQILRGEPHVVPRTHPLMDIYKKLGGDAYKMFTKYAYQYLMQNESLNEDIQNILKPKSKEEILDIIEDKGGVIQLIKREVLNPSGSDWQDDDFKLEGDELTIYVWQDIAYPDNDEAQLRIDAKFNVNIRSGEYDCDIRGESDNPDYSDFYYTDSKKGTITPYYDDPKGFANDLDSVLSDLSFNIYIWKTTSKWRWNI